MGDRRGDQHDGADGFVDNLDQAQLFQVRLGGSLVVKDLVRVHHDVGVLAGGGAAAVQVGGAVHVGAFRIAVQHGAGNERLAGVGFQIGHRQGAGHAGLFQGLEGGFVALAAGVAQRQRVADAQQHCQRQQQGQGFLHGISFLS